MKIHKTRMYTVFESKSLTGERENDIHVKKIRFHDFSSIYIKNVVKTVVWSKYATGAVDLVVFSKFHYPHVCIFFYTYI